MKIAEVKDRVVAFAKKYKPELIQYAVFMQLYLFIAVVFFHDPLFSTFVAASIGYWAANYLFDLIGWKRISTSSAA